MRRALLRWLLGLLAVATAATPLRAEVFYGIAPDSIWTVDVNTGGPAVQVATISPTLGANQNATLAVRPNDGMVFYLDSQNANPNLWRWNPLTPGLPPQLVGSTGLAAGVVRLVFDLGGTLYAMNTGAGATLWTLNQSTGAFITATATTGATTNGGGDICINPLTGAIFVVGGTALYTLDFSTGFVALVGTVTGIPGSMTGCAFDHTGRMVTSPGSTLWAVNTTTLVGTALPNATGATAFGDLGTAPGRKSDLSLAMVANNTTPGTTVSFTLTLTNAGPSTDTGVQVKDLLPAGLTFVSATPSQGTYASGTGIWNVGVLPVGSVTLTINATVTGAVSPVTNTAEVFAADNTDPDSTPNNVATNPNEDDTARVTVTPSPDLQLVKAAGATFAIGANGTYTLTVNNTLGSAASSGTITVTDTMPANLTIVGTPSGGAAWNCATSTTTVVTCTSTTAIAAGATSPSPITVTVLPSSGTSAVNTATVSGGGDGTPGNNSTTITTPICLNSGCADVQITKAGPATVTAGSTATYTVTARNTGGLATSADYTIDDLLPPGMTLVATPTGTGWTCTVAAPVNNAGGNEANCVSSTVISPGGTNPNALTIQVNVPNNSGATVTNTATVIGGGEPTSNNINNSSAFTSTVQTFDLTVTKTGPASFALGGGTGTYTFQVKNIGTAATTGTYTIDDPLPNGIIISTVPTGTGWTCTGAGSVNTVGGNRVTCQNSTVIAAGATLANNLTVLVKTDATTNAAPSVTNTATISDPNESTAINTGNNTSTITTTVLSADLFVSKSHNGTFPVNSTNQTYTITPLNLGGQATTGSPTVTTIVDTLPTGLTYVSATGTGWACSAAGQVVTCTSTTAIAANAQGNVITLKVNVGATGGTVDNVVTISGGGEPAQNNGNNSFTDTTILSVPPTVTKQFLTASITAGGTSVMRITIANPSTNPVSLQGIAFSDAFPAGMSVAATPAFSNTCGGTITTGNTSGDTTLALTGGGPVAPNTSCQINVTVTATTVGANVNTTSVINTNNSGTAAAASATLTVTAPAAPTVSKFSSPNPVGVGQAFTYTITINNSNATNNNMAFTDTMPSNNIGSLANVSISGGCGGTPARAITAGPPATYRVSNIDMTANAVCTIVFSGVATAAGNYTNGSGQFGTFAAPLAASSVTNVNDVLSVVGTTLTKSFSSPTVLGTPSTLTFTITNGAGAPAQSGLGFTETLPAGLTLAGTPATTQCNGTVTTSGGNAITLSGGSLPVNTASCTVVATVTASAVGTYNNLPGNVTVSTGMTNNATASVVFYSVPVLTKAFGASSIAAGGTSTLTFTLTVPSSNPTQTFSFTDSLPAGLVATGGATGGTCSTAGGGTVTAPASSGTITVTNMQVVNPATTCTITVPVTSAGAPTLGACPQAANTNGNASIGATTNITNSVVDQCVSVYTPPTLTKSFNPTTVGVGQASTLRLTMTNPAANGAALTGLSVTDPLGTFNLAVATPVNVVFTPGGCGTMQSRAAVGSGGFGATTAGHLEIQFQPTPSLAAGASCQVDIDVTPSSAGVKNNVTAAPVATGPVSLTGSTANASLSVLSAMTAGMTFTPAAVGTGDASLLTVTFTNPNATAVSGVGFTDNYPLGLANTASAGAVTNCGGTVTAANNGTSLVLSGATVPAGGSCTVTVNVTSATAASYPTSTGPIATANDGTIAAAGATLTVLTHPTLTKTFGPNPLGAGLPSTLTLTLSNANTTSSITGAAFTDNYPSGLTNATPSGGVTTCGGTLTATNGGNSVALSGGTIPANSSCTVTVNVQAAAGSYPNSIAANALTTTNAGSNAAGASDTLTVLTGLTVGKAFAPLSIGINDTSVLTITLTNPNATAVSGAAFTDSYPAGLVNTASAGPTNSCGGTLTANNGAASVALSGGTVPANGSCAVTVNVTSVAANTYPNSTGPVTTANAGTATAGSGTLTVRAHPTIAKAFGPNQVSANAASVLTITLTNGNAVALTGAAFTDSYTGFTNTATPAGTTSCGGTVSATASGSSVGLSGGTIPANGSCTVTVNVTGATPGSYPNTIGIGALSTTNGGANTAAASDTLVIASPLTVTKVFGPLAVGTGDPSVMTITLTNPNATAVTGATFTDAYPGGLLNTASAGGTNTCGGTLTANNGANNVALAGGTVPANGSCVVTVNVTAAGAAGYLNSTGSVTTANGGTSVGGSGTLTVNAHPTVTKSFGTSPIGVAGTSVMTITLANANAVALTGAAFTDSYPPGLVNATPAGGTNTCGGTLTANNGANSVALSGGSIPANSSCTVTVTVTSAAAGSYPNSIGVNTLTTTNGGNNLVAGSATLSVLGALTVTKVFAPLSVGVNDPSVLTITLANPNGTAVAGAAFTDTYPPGLLNTTPAGATNTCGGTLTANNNAGSMALSGGSVPANGSCTVTVNVSAASANTYPNSTGLVTTTNAGTAPAGSGSLTVLAHPTVAKAFNPSLVGPGLASVLTITLTNPNTVPVTGAAFTDGYPATVVNTATPAGATTCGGTATAASGDNKVQLSGGTIPASGSCTVTVNTTSSTPGSHTNTFAANALATTNAGSNVASASDTLTVTSVLTVAKAFAPLSIGTGDADVLTITLTNPNAIAVTGAAFTDTYPLNLVNTATPAGTTTCGPGTVTATNGGNSVALSNGTVPANGSCTVTVNVTSAAANSYLNSTGSVTTGNAGTATAATATLTVVQHATVAKTFAPSAMAAGATSLVTITLTNPNNTAINGVAFTDNYPGNVANTATPGATNGCGGALTAAANATSIALTGGTIPANGNCVITVNVTSNTVGSYTNTLGIGSVTSTNAGGNAVAGSGTLAVLAGLTVAESFTASTVGTGVGSLLTVTFTNPNATAVTGVAFTDNYPPNLLNTAAAGAASSCGGTVVGANNGLSLSLTGGTVPANGSCTVTVNVTSNTASTYPNPTGNVTTTNAGTVPGATATLTVLARPTVAKAFSPSPAAIGAVSTLTITLTNTNNTAITGAAFTDSYPPGLVNATPASGATNCGGPVTATNGGGSVALSGGTIPANGSCTVTVNVQAAASGAYANTIGVNGLTTTNAGNNNAAGSGTLNVLSAITVAKSFTPPTAGINATSLLTITLTNPNTLPVTGAAFTDTYPAGLANTASASGASSCGGTVTAANNGNSLALTGGTVPASSSCTVTVNVSAPAAIAYVNNTGSVATDTGTGASASATFTVLSAPVLTKAFNPTSMGVGGTSQLTITLTNPNTTPITGAAVTDTYPVGLVNATPATGTTSCGGTVTATNGGPSVALSGGTIPASGSCTVTVNVTSAAANPYANSIAANALTTTNAGSNAAAANATVTVLGALTAAKAFVPSSIGTGDTSVLTITLTNGNGTAATGAAFTDTYPAGLVNTATPSGTTTCAGGSVTAAAGLASLALSGATVPANGSCTVTVNVTSAAAAPYANTMGSITTANAGTTAGATGTLTVLTHPSIAKSFTPTNMGAGGTSLLTLTLSNTNATAITGAAFTDTYPSGLVNATPAGSTNTCGGTLTANNGIGSVALSGGTIPGNSSCTVTVNVTAAATGSYPNSIGIGGLASGNAGSSATAANATLTVLTGLTVAKVFTPASTGPGDPSVLSITLTNPNATAVTGAAFTDTYPPGLLNTASAGGTNTCGGTLTANNGANNVALSGGSVPANGSCVVTVNVSAASVGSYPNSTGPVNTTNAGIAAAGSAIFTVLPHPTLTKSFTPNNVAPNAPAVLTLTLGNTSATPVTGAAFTDTYPLGITNTATPAATTTCGGTATAAANGPSVALSGGTIPANGTCTVTVNVTGSTPNPYGNTVAAGGLTTANAGASAAAASATLTVNSALSVGKVFAPGSIGINDTSVLTITLTNPNGVGATGAAFTDSYPPGLANTGTPGATSSCGGAVTAAANGNSLALTGGTIPANGSCTVSVNVTSAAAAIYTNSTGSVTTTNAGTAGAATGTLNVLAHPTIAKSFTPNTVAPNAASVLTITLSNTNNTAITGAAFTDGYVPGLVNTASASGTSTCGGSVTAANNGNSVALTGGTIPANGSCTVTVNVTSATSNSYGNTLAINALTTTNAGNNTAAASATLTVLNALGVTMSFVPVSIGTGDTSVMTVTLTNSNATAATGAAFTDAYPAGLVNTASANGTSTCVGASVTAANSGASLALSGATVPAGGSCTVTVNVTSPAANVYPNATGVVTTTNSGSSPGAGASLTVLAHPTVAKSFAPTTVTPGVASVLTITLSNANTSSITGAAFTDTYPVGLVNTASASGATNCGGSVTAANGGGSVALTGGTIPAGGSCVVTVNVTSAIANSYANTLAGASISTGNAGTGTGSASATLTVLGALTVAKSFTPSSIGTNDASVLTITLTNPNATAVTGAALTDGYPGGLVNTSNASAATTCGPGVAAAANGGGNVTLTGGTVPAGGSCTVTVNVTSATANSYPNSTGSVTTTNAGTAPGASATLTVLSHPSVAKAFSPTSFATGGSSLLTITLSNTNSTPLTGATFTDSYPGGLVNAAAPAGATTCGGSVTASSGASTVALAGGTIPANGSCTVTVNVTSAAAGAYGNTIPVGGLITGNGGASTSAGSATVNVLAGLTVAKAFTPGSIGTGGTSVLTITLTNPNGTDATGVAFTDGYPPGLLNTASASGTTNCTGGSVVAANGGNSVTLSGATVTAGGSCTVTVNVTAASVGSYVNNTGAVTAANAGSSPGATATLTVLARPTGTKVFSPSLVTPGTPSQLTITLSNANGAAAITGAAFTDTYPSGLTNSATPAGSTNCGGTVTAAATGPSVALSGATIPAAGSCTVTVNVSSATPGVYNNNITAGTITSANAGTNAADVTGVLVVATAPGVTKGFTPSSVGTGDPSGMTITLTNANSFAATGASFTDNYPPGLLNTGTPAAASSCGGTVTAAANGGSITLTGGTIPANGSCNVTVNVSAAAANSYVNSTGLVNTTNAGSSLGGTGTLAVLGHPTATKTFNPTTVGAGTPSVLTITLSNANTSAITGAAFTDNYPLGLVNTASASGATTCGGTVTAANNGASVALTGGTIPAGSSCTVTVNVTSATANVYTNSLAANAITSGNAGSNAAVVSATLTVLSSLTSSMTFTPASIGTGDTSVLLVTLTNPNNSAITGVAFTDNYPSNLLNTSSASATNSCGGTLTAANNGTSLALTGGTIPANGSCSISVNVTSAIAAGYPDSTGTISTTNAGTAPGSSATLTVLAHPGIAKSFTPNVVGVNGTSVLTLTLSNTSNTAVTGAAFTDTYPTNLVNAASASGITTCGGTLTANNNGTGVALTGGTIPANGSCTVTVNVTSGTAAIYTNALAANALSSTNAGTSNAAASATLTVAQGLTVGKAFAPISIAPGDTSVQSITLTNPNAVAVTGVAFTDGYPGGLANTGSASPTNSCGGTLTAANNGTGVTLTGGTVPANSSCVVTVNVTSAAAGGYLNNTGTVSTTNAGNSGGAAATLTVLTRLTVAKAFVPASVGVGDPSVLSITLTNANNTAVTGATFTDTYPAGLTNTASASGTNTCGGTLTANNGANNVALTGGSVPANGSCVVTVNVTGAAATSYVNITSTVPTANAGTSPAATATLDVRAHPTVAMTFTAPSIGVGGTSTLTFTLTNTNAIPVTGAAFNNGLPAGVLNATPAAGATTCGGTLTATNGGNSVALTGGTIPANASCTVTVTVTSAAAGSYPDAVPVGGLTSTNAGANLVAANATLTVLTGLTAVETFTPGTVGTGVASVLTITFTNPNGSDVTGVSFTDGYPSNLANTATANGTTTCPGGAVTAANSGASLALAGATVPANSSCTVTVNVASAVANSYPNSTGPIATGNAGPVAPATATLTVLAHPTIAKLFAPGGLNTGGISVLTITLGNPNTTAITGAAFTDTYPLGLVNSASASGTTSCGGAVTAANGGPSVALSGGTIPANGSCTVTVNVTSAATGNYINTIGVNGLTTANAGNNTVAASDTLVVSNQLTVAMSFTPGSIGTGDPSVMTVTLTNPNAVAVTGAAFTDNYPAGLVNTASASGATTCGGTVTAANNGASLALTGGTIPANGSCTVTVNVTSGTASSYPTSTGNVTTANAGTAAGASATLFVMSHPSATKSFTPSTTGIGTVVALTITLNNASTSAINGVAFNDGYPANLANAASPAGATTCGGTVTAIGGGNSLALSGGTIPANGSCTVTVSVTASAAPPGGLVNTLAVGSITSTNAGANTVPTTGTLTVLSGLTVTKAFAAGSVGTGDPSVMTITLANGNATAVTGAAFTDTYPSGLVNTASAGAATNCAGGAAVGANGGNSVTLSGATVPANGSCTVSVNVTSAAAASYLNSIGPVTTGNAGTVTGGSATLAVLAHPTVAKSFTPSTVAPNGTSQLTITLTNPSATTAITGAAFSDSYPLGLVNTASASGATTCGGSVTAANGGNSVALTGGTIPANGSCTVTVNVTSAASGGYPNTIAGGALTTTNAGASQAPASATLTVLSGLGVTMGFVPAFIGTGDTSVMTITFTNSNATAVTGAAFTDTYPSGMVNTASASGSSTCAGAAVTAANGGGNLVVTGATVPANSSCTVTVNVTSAAAATYPNSTGAITTTNAGGAAGASATLTVMAHPTVTKSFTPSAIGSGGTSVLTITLGNTNGAAITGAAFTDTYAGAINNAATPAAATSCGGTVTAAANGNSVALSGGTIPAAGSCTVTLTVTSSTIGAQGNTIAAGAVTSTNAGNSTAAASASLTVLAGPTVGTSFTPQAIGANGTSVLTITLTNPNATAVTGAAFTDTYPPNLFNGPPFGATTTCGGTATALNNGTSVALSGGTVPANGSCTVTVNVTSATPASYPNSTGPVTTTNAGIASAATATLDVLQAPAVTKTFTPPAVAPGATSVLTIGITNPNAIAISGAALTDAYPAGLANAATPAASFAGAGCTGTVAAVAGANNVTLSTGSIPAGSTCTVTVTVTAPAPGIFNNSSGPVTTTNAGTGAAASATLSVFASPTVTKSFAPTSIPAGGTATMTIVVSNPAANPANLTNVAVTDTYPAGLTNAAAGSVVCSAGGGAALAGGVNGGAVVGFAGGIIAPGGSCTITQAVTSSGSLTNTTGTVTSNQAAPGTAATASLAVASSPTILKAFSPASVALGATSTLSFTLTNPNAIALTSASFTDAMAGMAIDAGGSAGGTCAGASGNNFVASQTNLTFSGLTIPASGACTVTVTVRGTLPGANPNTASGVSSTQAATGAASNTATLTVTSSSPSVAKAFTPNAIDPGAVSVLTITVSNPNAAAITVTSVTDGFPGGLSASATPNLSTTCAGGAVGNTATSVTLTGGTVPANGSCQFTIDTTSASTGSSLTNTIAAGALTTSAGASTVAASAVLQVRPVANLAVTKTAPATVVNGATLTWTVVVSNAGPQAANDALFSDAVPAAMTGVTATCGGATGLAACGAVTLTGNNVASTVTTLPAGGTVTFTISGTAPQSGSITNTAKIIAPAGVVDPTDPGNTGAGNNSASASTNVVSPDLRVSLTHPGNFTVGVNGVYTITADNALGSAPTSGTITVTDTLPAGLTFVSATGTSWTCAAVAQVVTCTSSASIAAGAASANPITVTVAVGSPAVPSVTNAASISGGGEPTANNGNNTAFDPTNVSAAAVNTFAPDNAQTGAAGTTIYYAHTFNAGSAGSVAFTTSSVQSPSVAGWTQVVYRDTDCSGTLNGTEGSSPLSGAVAVASGGTVCIIVADNIPAAAPFNAQNVITVTSTFNGTQTIARVDTTTVSAAGGAGLQLAKAVRNVTLGTAAGTANTARPGDILEYTITYSNPGAGTLSAVVITDSTPAFTTYQAGSCVTPLPANITSCNVTTQPAVNATGSVVWTLGGSLAAGASGTVLYTVRVAP